MALVEPFRTPIPVTRSLAHPLNRLRGTFRTRRMPFQSRVYQLSPRFWWNLHQCPSAKHQDPCWPAHIRNRTWSLLPPLVRLLSARRLGQSSHLYPDTPRPTTTSRVGVPSLRTWSWNPRPSCSTRFLHASRGCYFWINRPALHHRDFS